MSNLVKIVSVEQNDEFVQLINEYVARMIAKDEVEPVDYPDEYDDLDDLDGCDECDECDEIPELPEILQGFKNEFREEDREYFLLQSFFELAVELYYNLSDSEDNREIALVLLLKTRDAAMCSFILQNLNKELEN